jgi:hypothetical protein
MVCCTSAIPVLLGLSEQLHRLLGGASLVFSCLNSIFLTSGEPATRLFFSFVFSHALHARCPLRSCLHTWRICCLSSC